MKAKLLYCTVVAAIMSAPAFAADVGVSVQVGQPGFFGRIDIGRFPQPVVINQQPVIVQATPVAAQPLYLRVPPGHARHWSKHCSRYRACGQPVYFVQDQWYQNQVVMSRPQPAVMTGPGPTAHGRHQREWQGEPDGRGHEHGRDHGRRD